MNYCNILKLPNKKKKKTLYNFKLTKTKELQIIANKNY